MSNNELNNSQGIDPNNSETLDNNQNVSNLDDNNMSIETQSASEANDNDNIIDSNHSTSSPVEDTNNIYSSDDLDNPEEGETAIIEILDIVKSEYEIERSKKESFENRASIVLAFIGALCVFVLEKITLSEIISMCHQTLTFVIWIKIVTGFIIYFSLGTAIIFSFLTIRTKKHLNFEVDNINMSLMKQKRIKSLIAMIKAYRSIILQHRVLNENRSKTFSVSLICSIISIFAIVVYYSF